MPATVVGADVSEVLNKFRDVEQVVPLPEYRANYSRMDARVYLRGGQREIPLSTDCTLKFLSHVGAPRRFLHACEDSELSDQLLSYCVSKAPQIQVLSRHGIGESVAPFDFPTLTTFDLLSTATSAIEVESPRFGGINVNGSLYAEIIVNEAQEPPSRVGDISRAGVAIHRNGKISVASYIYRLACTNGMICMHEENIKVVSSINREQLLSGISHHVQEAVRLSKGSFLPQFVSTVDTEVGDPSSLFAGLARDGHISSRMAEELIAVSPAREGDTLYDAINLVTRHANSFMQEHRIDEALKLQRLGGFLAHPIDRCNNCHRRL